jgi:hypothetical protein
MASPVALAQIDMTLPQQVRLMISSSSSCLDCTLQAQYYNGTAWTNLTNSIAPTKSTVFVTAWTIIPSGANGDYPVRLAISDSGTTQVTVGLHSAINRCINKFSIRHGRHTVCRVAGRKKGVTQSNAEWIA